MAPPKTKWKTVRCVVKYRTPSDLSERDLARIVQAAIDHPEVRRQLGDSKAWAQAFMQSIAKMEAVRPRRLLAAARAADALAARLRKI